MMLAWAAAVLLTATVSADARPFTATHHSFGAIVEGFAILVVLVFAGRAVHDVFGAVRDWLRKGAK